MDAAAILTINTKFVLREEYDDWAILFNPDTSATYGMNPISTFIYKHLDGFRSADEIAQMVTQQCKNLPDDAHTTVLDFMKDLVLKGIAEIRVPQ